MVTSNTQPVPLFEQLTTERLLLRPYDYQDAPARWEAIEESRAHLHLYEPEQAESCRTLVESQLWIANARTNWLMRSHLSVGMWHKATGQYLGGVGINPRDPEGWRMSIFSLGYWVRVSAEGHGYVTEAVRRINAFVFADLQAKRVEILCAATNTRSTAVAQRLGFRLETRLPQAYLRPDGVLTDEFLFVMLADDFQRLSATR